MLHYFPGCRGDGCLRASLAVRLRALFEHSDLIAYHLGLKWAAYRSIQAGEGLPFWKSDQLSGGPALTNPQAMYANPFYLLFDLIDPATAAGPTLWLQFLLMGLGMYLWGWSIGLHSAGRLFMAVAGMLNFKLIIAAYAGWMTVIPRYDLPHLAGGGGLRCARPGIGSAGALGAAGTVFLVSGHPQFLYYTLLLAAGCVVAHALPAGPQGRWRERLAPRCAWRPGPPWPSESLRPC